MTDGTQPNPSVLLALSPAGLPLTGLTWASSDPTVVSLSTDDPPILTAVAAGHITITAGTGSADVTVSATPLVLGTTIWSNPGDGSGVYRIVPAVPSPSGVADVFAFQNDGTVAAITSDGATAWTADVSQAIQVLPDFMGGLAVETQSSIYRVDGITGQPYPAYTIDSDAVSLTTPGTGMVLHTDGTIFSVEFNYGTNAYSVVGIDPTAGTQKFAVSLANSSYAVEDAGTAIIAGDGYACLPYQGRTFHPTAPDDGLEVNHLMLLQVDSSGNSQKIGITDWTGSEFEDVGTPAYLITNADQGVVVAWSQNPGSAFNPQPTSYYMATVTAGNVAMVTAPQLPGQNDVIIPVLQAQDGSYVGTVPVGDDYTTHMVAFDQAGNVRWSVVNEQPQIATDDGGVIGQSGITYDSIGNATGAAGSLPTYSWTGEAYQQQGSVEQTSANLLFVLYDVASSFWAMAGGNYSENATAYSLIRTFSDNEASSDITVSNFSQTGANQQTITNVLNDILQGLNSGKYAGCSTWLTGAAPFSISTYVTNLISLNSYGHGPFNDNDTAAFVGTRNQDGTLTGLPASGAAFAVNDAGAFFNAKVGNKTSTIGPRGYTGGILKAKAAILIHELGHKMSDAGGAAGFKPDAGSRQAGRDNDQLVEQYCGKLIGGLR